MRQVAIRGARLSSHLKGNALKSRRMGKRVSKETMGGVFMLPPRHWRPHGGLTPRRQPLATGDDSPTDGMIIAGLGLKHECPYPERKRQLTSIFARRRAAPGCSQ